MANNRMYLVNKKLGVSILIAKYYPSTGWYVKDHETLALDLNNAFHKADFGDINYKEVKVIRKMAKGGMHGNTDWEIEYEVKS